MIIVIKNNTDKAQVDNLIDWVKSQGLSVNVSVGQEQTVLGLIGDVSSIDIDLVRGLSVVENVMRISEPYKNANRKFHPDDTIVEVENATVGGKDFAIIAGPCSVESKEQICEIAIAVKQAGATMLRGGAFKPRTSPYDFQGLRGDGIELLLEAKKLTGLPIVTEIMDLSQLELFNDVDVVQVGARNMQNMELLKALGRTKKPVLLKRGLSSTLKELLMSAEYIMAGGNGNVILCERGIRTFETATRNTLDISAVPALKEFTHLPVIVDPSHASGIARYVAPLTYTAAAAGAHGVMIEVHNNPSAALCDGAQSLTPDEFAEVVTKTNAVLEALK
ncbi:MAG: 3-deoxy-7-phosphoheptulonate synthase [Oscillospiraceae bacterium]|nr:3-deoxy-7-phosphoheptulonate synthase [Oscillospiraceae bacterium]